MSIGSSEGDSLDGVSSFTFLQFLTICILSFSFIFDELLKSFLDNTLALPGKPPKREGEERKRSRPVPRSEESEHMSRALRRKSLFNLIETSFTSVDRVLSSFSGL